MPPPLRDGVIGVKEVTSKEERERDMQGGCRDISYQCLDLPLFNGDDALEWIVRYERYFDVNHLYEKQRLMVASVCIKGIGHGWLKWREKQKHL